MLPFLEFTFASFWHFAGIVILIGTAASALGDFIRALFIRRGWGLVSPKIKETMIEAIREERRSREGK